FVLRLHRPGYNSLAELESERRWTQTLADNGLTAPTGITARDGRPFVRVAIPGTGEQRHAGITRWMHGRPLDELLQSAPGADDLRDAYRRIGRIAARMHTIASNWSAPDDFTRPRLDTAGLLGEAPRWGRFWEHPGLSDAARRHLLALRFELADDLEAYGCAFENFGLIHADLHAENIIIGEDRRAGVIDFDDLAWGWYVYDLATALVDHWGQADYAALRDALLQGYGTLRPLNSRDLAMLDRLVLLRALTLVGWYGERPEHGGQDYFQRVCEVILGQSLRDTRGRYSAPWASS
ncbi:MAG: phosphotransferase, partial [Halieaceae bacterium]|nr:phosphotransferase [Halieaceae bacterium]